MRACICDMSSIQVHLCLSIVLRWCACLLLYEISLDFGEYTEADNFPLCAELFLYFSVSVSHLLLKIALRSPAYRHLTSCWTRSSTHTDKMRETLSSPKNNQTHHFVLAVIIFALQCTYCSSFLYSPPPELHLTLFVLIILSCSSNHCPRAFSFYLHPPSPRPTPFLSVRGGLALCVDLRRSDIQRPVPCLQH